MEKFYDPYDYLVLICFHQFITASVRLFSMARYSTAKVLGSSFDLRSSEMF